MMNVFETSGQAQMLLGEGNRQIMFALVAGARRGLRQIARLLGGS